MKENRGYGFLVNKRIIGLCSKLMVFIVMLLGLSSCAVYENKFDCSPGKGANCSSVEEIEQMVNNGRVWKVNGKVKVVTPKKRLRENCAGGSCDNSYEFDDGLRSESNPGGEFGNIKRLAPR